MQKKNFWVELVVQQDSFKICNLCSKEVDICLMNFGVYHATSSEATQIDFFGILAYIKPYFLCMENV